MHTRQLRSRSTLIAAIDANETSFRQSILAGFKTICFIANLHGRIKQIMFYCWLVCVCAFEAAFRMD